MVRTALLDAASVASLLTTAECIIVEAPKEVSFRRNCVVIGVNGWVVCEGWVGGGCRDALERIIEEAPKDVGSRVEGWNLGLWGKLKGGLQGCI